MRALARHALVARRLVGDHERRDAQMRALREREHPADLDAVGPVAAEALELAQMHAGLAQDLGVAGHVVGLQAEVDQPAAAGERRPPAMGGPRLGEAHQLQVRRVAKADERVRRRAFGVAPAGHHREAEVAVGLDGAVQVGDGDDQVIDGPQHQPSPSAGATSPRKRSS